MDSPRMKRARSGLWLMVFGSVTALAVACGDDESSDNAGKGGTASTAGKGGTGGKAGAPAGGGLGGSSGTSVGGDSAGGMAGAGGDGLVPGAAVTFEIPAAGGEVQVATASGNIISFDFPASAGGQTVTLTPDTSASVGWTDGRFVDVIKMEPDGATFDDPVAIRLSSNDLLLFDFDSSGAKSPADGLALSAGGDALLLEHFSTLVVVPAGVSCDSTSGWIETADGQGCADMGANTSRMDFTCKAYSYCLLISASCCAAPGSTECKLGDPALTLTYTPTDTSGVQNAYCDRGSGSGGAGGAGGSGGAAGAGNPPNGSIGCFQTGTEASPTGAGTCADPYVISLGSNGAVASHTATTGSATWDGTQNGGGASACAGTPTRSDIYRINPFIGWSSIDVGVDAVTGSDTKISVFYSDMDCSATTEAACENTNGSATCEAVNATSVQLATNAIFVAVTTAGVNDSVTARFKIY